MSSKDGVAVGVFGASGQVGSVMRALLKERSFPVKSMRYFASARSAGTTLLWGDDEIGAGDVVADAGIAKVSLIGAGMKTHPGIAATMFEVLAKDGINIEMISTSPIRISCVVRADRAEDALQSLHEAFELES